MKLLFVIRMGAFVARYSHAVFFTIMLALLLLKPDLVFATNYVCPDTSRCDTYTSLGSCNSACPNSGTYPCYQTSPPCIPGPYPSGGSTPSPAGAITTPEQVINVLNNILQMVYKIFFIVAAMFIIFAAFSFLSAGGDEEKIRNAKQKLLYAVIAIAITLVSFSVATLTRDVLVNAPLPTLGGGFGANCNSDADCLSNLRCLYVPSHVPPGSYCNSP